jgi:hypothetical protein
MIQKISILIETKVKKYKKKIQKNLITFKRKKINYNFAIEIT